MLEVIELRGGWGETTIVDGVSFAVAPGETLAIIGRNGVGKTTLLDLIVGRARRHDGDIRLNGKDVVSYRTHERANRGLAYVPQQREIFPSLTVRENMAVARQPGTWTEERVLSLFPSLTARLGNLGGHLSGGEQQMVAIARALMTNPKVLLMDEPSEGLAPIVIENLVTVIREVVKDRSIAIVLVEQRVDIALDLSSHCMVMDRGKVVLQASSAALRNDLARLIPLIGFDP